MRALGLLSLPPCLRNGMFILAHLTLIKLQLKSSPNSIPMMPYSHAIVDPLPCKPSKHLLPHATHGQTSSVQTQCVVKLATPLRGASNLEVEWKVSTQTGGRKREKQCVMLPLLGRSPDPHFSFLTLFPSYHPIHTMDYLMLPPFLDPLITM